MSEEYMKKHYVACSCLSSEHTLRYMYCDDMDGGDLLWTSVYLNNYRSVMKRIWIAIKYVFGYKSRYGHFDCTSMSLEEGEKLYAFLQQAIKSAKDKRGEE